MANRPEMVPFLGSKIEEANRFARIDERVLANEILDFRLRLVIESVIGGANIREFRLAAASRNGSPGQQRIARCDRAEGAVGMPQPITELEKPDAIVRIHQRAISRQVGEIGNAGAKTFLLALADMTWGFVALEIAEARGEGELLLVRQRLIAKDEHGVSRHALADGGDIFGRERFGATDVGHHACKDVRKCADDSRHLRFLLAPDDGRLDAAWLGDLSGLPNLSLREDYSVCTDRTYRITAMRI